VVCFVSGFRSSNSRGDLLSATVHIVDDNPSFRTATGRLLQACGYAVALYESGEELLAQLPKDAGSNCILLDVRIPGLSGPDLQVRLNDMGSHLPIVFLTGHGDISTTVQVIKAGAEDLLTKPVAKDKLLAAIELAAHEAAGGREARRIATAPERPDPAGAPSFRTRSKRGIEQADRV
jgi:FixJ family two-component response regulator